VHTLSVTGGKLHIFRDLFTAVTHLRRPLTPTHKDGRLRWPRWLGSYNT